MTILKATSLIKSRQANVLLRETSPRIVRYLAQLAHGSLYSVGEYCPLPVYSDNNPPRSYSFVLNSNLNITNKNADSFLLLPQSPTSEGLGSGQNNFSSLSEVASIDIPFMANASKPIVKTWNHRTPFGVQVHPWQQFYFDYGVTGIPKSSFLTRFPDEDKFYLSKGFGEDAYFIRRDSLGVADGVGGWKKIKGADSAFFSRNLMHFACEELAKFDNVTYASSSKKDSSSQFCPNSELNSFYNQIDPIKILESSYRLATESASVYKIKGSSTACIVILRNKELRIANLGDCGVVVLRDSSIVFKTAEQQHSFNFPYQLGTNSRDRPKDAQSYSVPVQRGDVIIMGSDGLFDNLFDSDIEEEVSKWSPSWAWDQIPKIPEEILSLSSAASTLRNCSPNYHSSLRPGDLSHALATRACQVSQQTSEKQETPFKEKAISEGFKFKGGKRDDITVLVAVVAPCFSD